MVQNNGKPMVKPKGLHHVALTSFHFDDTIGFYQEGLGFTIKHTWGHEDRVYMMDMGDGGCIEVFEGGKKEVEPCGRWMHIAIKTDNIQASYDQAIRAGGKAKLPPTFAEIVEATPKQVNMYFAYVIGFDQEEIEFIQEATVETEQKNG